MTPKEQITAIINGVYIKPKSVELIGATWEFIEKYHPNYYRSNEIAWIDDLECAILGECDSQRLERVKMWGQSEQEWLSAHYALMSIVTKMAYENYKRINNIK